MPKPIWLECDGTYMIDFNMVWFDENIDVRIWRKWDELCGFWEMSQTWKFWELNELCETNSYDCFTKMLDDM